MTGIIDTEWWTIERADGTPLATRRGWPITFSRREYAEPIMARAALPGARLVRHAGEYDAIRLLELAAKAGAARIVTDSGQPFAYWVAIGQGAWDFDGIRQARAAAAGLELA